MTSNHIGLLSAYPAALGLASCKRSTPPVVPHAVYGVCSPWPLLERPPASYKGLLVLIYDSAQNTVVNPGFTDRKGAR